MESEELLEFLEAMMRRLHVIEPLIGILVILRFLLREEKSKLKFTRPQKLNIQIILHNSRIR